MGDGVGKTAGAGWVDVGSRSGAVAGDGGSFTGLAVGIGLINVVGGGVDVGLTVGLGAAVAAISEVAEGSGIVAAGLVAGVDISWALGIGVA